MLSFAVIALATVYFEKKRHGALEIGSTPSEFGWKRFYVVPGHWFKADLLTLLNFATLALAGRPWGVTSALAVWAAKAASLGGIDVASWAYWQQPGNAKALTEPLWFDVTSMMNFGIMLGALLAASLAGKFALTSTYRVVHCWLQFWAVSYWAMVPAWHMAATLVLISVGLLQVVYMDGYGWSLPS